MAVSIELCRSARSLAGTAASGIEGAGHARNLQPMMEALKPHRKREKAVPKAAALGIEKFTVEVAGIFKADLQRAMKAHGINNQQDVHQRLLLNLIAADFEAEANMLHIKTTPFVVTEKVSRLIEAAGRKSLDDDPPEPDDEIDIPN